MNDVRTQHPCPNHDTSRMRVNRLIAEAILDQRAAHDAVLAKQSMIRAQIRLSRVFETVINQDMVEIMEAYPTTDEHCVKVRTALDSHMRGVKECMDNLNNVLDEGIANLVEQGRMLAVRYLHATDVYRKSGGTWWDAEFTFKAHVAPENLDTDPRYQAVRMVLEPFGFKQTSHRRIGKDDCVNRHSYTFATTIEGLCALLLEKRHGPSEATMPVIDRVLFFVPNLCHATDEECRTPQQALERKDATDPVVSESRCAFEEVWIGDVRTRGVQDAPRDYALGVLTQLLPRQARPHVRYTIKRGDVGSDYTLCDNAAHCIPDHIANPKQYAAPSPAGLEVA